jgi:hypothetical protein
MEGEKYGFMTFKRNLHSLAAFSLILGGGACPFLRQTRITDAMFLPVIRKLGIYIVIPDFKWQSSKDNFYRPLIAQSDSHLTV